MVSIEQKYMRRIEQDKTTKETIQTDEKPRLLALILI